MQQQIDLTLNQIDYLESIAFFVKTADDWNMKEIEEELSNLGLMRKKVDLWLENANIFVDMKKELWYKNKWLENANTIAYI